jgi:pyruvate formate lyase activating enzyme
MTDEGKVYDRELCKVCGRCVEECYAGSLAIMGSEMTVEEVLTEVEKDRPFYETSAGGVTYSGGEPLLQIEFTAALLRESKRRHLHTTVDTALCIPWQSVANVKPHTDLFLIDVKTLDNDLHRRITGVGNTRVLENLHKLADGEKEIWIRVPVVPGLVNDSEREIEALVDFVGGLEGIEMVELLPYHRLAEAKYRSLGLEPKRYETPPAELMDRLKGVLTRNGIATARQKKAVKSKR